MPRRSSNKKFPLSKQVKSNKRAISRLKKAPERKIIDGFIAVANLSAGVTAFLLNGMQKGTSWGERIGNEVKMINLSLNVFLKNTDASPQHVRLMVLFEKNPEGGLIDTDDVFDDITSNLTKTLTVSNPVHTNDFSILYDKVHTLSTSASDFANSQKLIKIRKLLRRKTLYNALDNGDFQDLENNALYVIVVTSVTGIQHYQSFTLGYSDQ